MAHPARVMCPSAKSCQAELPSNANLMGLTKVYLKPITVLLAKGAKDIGEILEKGIGAGLGLNHNLV